VAISRNEKRRSSISWALFGLRGRISRGVYWLAYAAITCVQSAVIMQLFGGEEASYYRLASALGPAILLGSLYATLAISVKRLHDCDYPGLISLVAVVPLVNLAFTIWLGVVPGTAGPNRFGAGANGA
jgi:uncharacterized membrane protein YhaH (DUF805 family)